MSENIQQHRKGDQNFVCMCCKQRSNNVNVMMSGLGRKDQLADIYGHTDRERIEIDVQHFDEKYREGEREREAR